MNRHPFTIAAIALVIALVSAGALAQSSGGEFAITRSVIGSGGGESAGGTFRLRGTVAQPVAGQTASGGEFSVRGGFWIPLAERADPIFRDSFEN